ncbi:MAG: AAA family ATPase [Nostoc sp.]|uniref:pentapeptide repeat-containing protein n=1 Tax=Nostoc sp. TaxID=1180 RepID=UPI002FF7171A
MDASQIQEEYEAGKRNFRQVNLSKAYLRGACLRDADLSGANLSRAFLYDANLSQAELSRANLSGADLSESKLTGANLCGCDLTGADLTGCDLEGALYNEGLQGTQFPQGFDPGAAKMSLLEIPNPSIKNPTFIDMIDELPYAKCQQELQYLLQAQCPLIFLRSPEESRALNCAITAHQAIISNLNDDNRNHSELARWNSINGFLKHSLVAENTKWDSLEPRSEQSTKPVEDALNVLQKRLQEQAANYINSQNTYLLPDWSALISPECHLTARQLKELIIAIEQKKPRPKMTLIVIGSDWSMPTILRPHVHILDLPLPIGQELYDDVFSQAVSKYNLPVEQAEQLAEQAQGMPLHSVTQTAKLITARQLWSKPLDAGQLLLEVKKQEIRKTGVLEYYAPQGQGLNEVGGLEEIKNWIIKRRPWFEQDSSPELRPRAILLEGFPGCGKTFIARAIAQEWRVPQINFEISRLQSKWVGESESNTFQALRAIEASAPNILFMDEIEKAFAGVGGDSSGVSTRQFGTFLSWLNDHKYPIFFIATSNDRTILPPELFRAGRFDEIFIVMPPNTNERADILQKRAQAYNIKEDIPPDIISLLVENTKGFSGAELDKLVKEAIYLAGFPESAKQPNLPNEEVWQQALKQIAPQYPTPKMQDLLTKYLHLLNEGGGKPASLREEGFLESLRKPQNQRY